MANLRLLHQLKCLTALVIGSLGLAKIYLNSKKVFAQLQRLFVFPKSGYIYSYTNSYNIAMTSSSQDDHLRAGAWAASD